MKDLREQIVGVLTPVCENISAEYPDVFEELPLIVYGEITNVTIGKWTDRIEIQIDVYDKTFSDCISMTEDVDAVMKSVGFIRTYTSPDVDVLIQRGVYHKALSYLAKIDTHNNRIIYNFY